MVWHFALSINPIMFSGVHILMNGKSDMSAICTASAVLPQPTGPKTNKGWMNEEWRVVDETTTDSLPYIFNMWTVSSDVSIQRRHWQPLSVHLWAYCTHPTHDVNDVMCEGWPQHRGLRPQLFSNSGVGSFTSHKNQISVSAVRRDKKTTQWDVSITCLLLGCEQALLTISGVDLACATKET